MRNDEFLHHFILTVFILGGYLLTLFIVIFCSFFSPKCRKVVFSGALPQLVMALLVSLGLSYLARYSVAVLTLLESVWVLFPSLLLILVINKWSQRSLVWTCVCHTICLLLLFWQVQPTLFKIGFNHQQLSQLAHAEQQNFRTLDAIYDTQHLERMLLVALKSPENETSENAFRYLSKRISPFAVPSVGDEKYFSRSFFTIALEHYNTRAIRAFSRFLQGDSQQAQEYREIVRQYNPLQNMYQGIRIPIRYNKDDIARQLVAAREISLTLLPLMPELLTQEAYANVIDAYDSATLKAFWQIQPPPTSVLRLEALSVIPNTVELVQQVKASPTLLESRDKSGRTVLTYVVRFGNIAAIQALIDANLIDWQRFTQLQEHSTPLLLATWRQKYEDDHETFPLILKDMLAKNTPLAADEIMNCIKDGMTPDDFLTAGMSQTQFCTAIEESFQAKELVLSVNQLRRMQSSMCTKK
ncbi:hypothetical protein [Escherichia sp. MOD1-EC7003]|uniref:hypothetical protein n=1 Tax=Escherichia sp. MOD1-EC7003 TaxID=2093900 RepID=UPI001F0590E9|nr:hypothetical protein [Escherichia sp. MOD1-EC7003]